MALQTLDQAAVAAAYRRGVKRRRRAERLLTFRVVGVTLAALGTAAASLIAALH